MNEETYSQNEKNVISNDSEKKKSSFTSLPDINLKNSN